MNTTSQHAIPHEYSGGREDTRMRQACKKKPSTGLSDFSVLGEDQDAWSASTKTGPNDEVPLRGIQVQKEYEQKVEEGGQSDGWLEDGRRKSWYPGNS